jgi:3-oxoacyl-[acyl-carrier protein] reductase
VNLVTFLSYAPRMQLRGKRALVIGGGIGRATTDALGNEGAAVVVADLDRARAASYITGQQIVLDGGVSVRGPFE